MNYFDYLKEKSIRDKSGNVISPIIQTAQEYGRNERKNPNLYKTLPISQNSKIINNELVKKVEKDKLNKQFESEINSTKKEIDNIYRSERYSELQSWINTNTKSKQSIIPDTYNERLKEFDILNNKAKELNDKVEDLKKRQIDINEVTTKDRIVAPLNNAYIGIQMGARSMGNLINRAIGNEELLYKGETPEEYKDRKVSEKQTRAERILSDISRGVGQNVFAAPANLLIPGGSLAVLGVSSAGEAYKQAKEEGESDSESLTYGVLSGVSEAGMQKLLGGIKVYGKSIVGKQVGDKTSKVLDNVVKSENGKKAVSIIGNSLGEGTEEYIQAVLEPVYRNIAFKENNNIDPLSDEALYSGFLGALTSSAMNLPYNIKESIDVGRAKKQNNILPKASEQLNQFQPEALPKYSELNNANISNTNLPNDYFTSAKKYNLDTNSETIKSIDKVTTERGIKATYDANVFKSNNIDALWRVKTDENGNTVREVVINPNADTNKTLQSITIHELTHDLEGTQEFDKLKRLALDYDKSKDGYLEARQSLEDAYSQVYDKNSDNFSQLVDNEAVADVLGSRLGDQQFINNLSQKDISISKKVYNWVTDKLNKINKLTGYKSEKLYWADVKNKFETSFKQDYSNSNTNQTKFSIQTDSNGGKYVKVDTDQDIFDGIPPKEYSKIARKYILDKYKTENKKIMLPTAEQIKVTNKTASEYAYPKNKLSFDKKDSKMRASTELDNLLKVSKHIHSAKDDGRHSFAKDGWDYYKTVFEVDGKRFEGLINIGTNGGVKTLYDITNIKEVSHISYGKNLPESMSILPLTNNSIAPDKTDVNTTSKYSMQNNQNNVWNNRLDTIYANKFDGQRIRDLVLPKANDKFLPDTRNNIENFNTILYNESRNGSDVNGLGRENKNSGTENERKYTDGGRSKGSSSSSMDTQKSKITNREAKEELISYAMQNRMDTKLNISKEIQKISNKLGIDVVIYQRGNTDYSGLTKQNKIYLDKKSGVRDEVLFSHELLHWLRINNNEDFNKKIKPIINEIAQKEEYQELLLKYVSENELPLEYLNGKYNNILAEEVVANYTSKILAEYDIDYDIGTKNVEKLTNALTKIIDVSNLNGNVIKEFKSEYNNTNQISTQKDHELLAKLIPANENANKVSYFSDFYRNIRNIFGEENANKITGEFDKAKLNNVKMQNKYASQLKTEIVDKLGIKKGSKESALVQKYGEKEITFEQLKRITPNKWNDIVKADNFFREQYNKLIEDINETRKKIYPGVEARLEQVENELYDINAQIKVIESEGMPPFKVDLDLKNNIERLEKIIKDKTTIVENSKNKETLIFKKNERILNESRQRLLELQNLSESRSKSKLEKLKQKSREINKLIESEELWRGKRIPKRNDYYRHFNEMAEGFKALHNIITTPADINTNLAGISEFTKPNSKWLNIAQKRTGNETKYDAVGGFLNYIPSASYAINIDPQIKNLRDFTEKIRNETSESKNANKLIEYLEDFTNGLAGKTNPFDRPFQKVIGRKALKGIEWVTGRLKANAILGNVNSSISQILNLPQVIGKVKNPIAISQGFMDTIIKKGDYSQSQFILERFNSDIQEQFETNILQQPKKVAKWMLNMLDETVTKTGWNALYRQAQVKGINNPVQYADNIMRDLVGGRGIGEKTIAQDSKIVGMLAPFTLEVGNLWRVMGDFTNKKDFLGLIITFIASNLLIKGLKSIGASGSTFDPIEALKEALTEEDLTILERLGRVAGEIAGSLPLGQQLATLYPEYGADLGIMKLPTRTKLFGKNDPTRFGTGSIYGNILKNPLTTLATPWGGKQIEKTVNGAKALADGGVYKKGDKSNELKYPVDFTTENVVKSLTLGNNSLPSAKDYIENDFKGFNERETKIYKEANIPYDKFSKYTTSNFGKKIEKVNFVNGMDISDDKKWIIYKHDILDNEEREKDKGSQLLDAEFAIKDGYISKKEYMRLYNLSIKENISMPQIEELVELKKNKISLSKYIEFKSKTSEKKMPSDKDKLGNTIKNTRKVKVIDYLLSSNMSDNEKSYMFAKEFTDSDPIVKTEISMNEYLKLQKNIAFIEGTEDKKSQIDGKVIPGSKKKKVMQEIVKIDATPTQKMLMTYLSGYSIEDGDYKGIDKSGARKKVFSYIDNLDVSIKEKEVILKKAGYSKLKNGKWSW